MEEKEISGDPGSESNNQESNKLVSEEDSKDVSETLVDINEEREKDTSQLSECKSKTRKIFILYYQNE